MTWPLVGAKLTAEVVRKAEPCALVAVKMTAGCVTVATSVWPWALVRVAGTGTKAVASLKITEDTTVVCPLESVWVTGTGTATGGGALLAGA
jgi:hypothetical protein